MEKITQAHFLEMFNRVKSEQKGRKTTTKALIGATERNFKALVKAGYTLEDMEKALIAMFKDSEQWAVNSGNDTPAHFLRHHCFERYLNLAENQKKKEVAKKTATIEIKPKEIVYTKEEIHEAMKIYEDSLKAGKWIGKMYDASKIVRYFIDFFTEEERENFTKQGEEIAEKAKRTQPPKGARIEIIMDRMAKLYPERNRRELLIKEAVKRGIQAPWKKFFTIS